MAPLKQSLETPTKHLHQVLKCGYFFTMMFIAVSLGIMSYEIITNDSINNYYYNNYIDGYLNKYKNNKNTVNKTNPTILIVMAIDCIYDIDKTIKALQYKRNEMNVFWYFNVYNQTKCEYDLVDMIQIKFNRNIVIVNDSMSKMKFWMKYLNPTNIKNQFNETFDYIWCIDEDLLLKYFNFYSFFKISYFINSSISTPSISSRCKTCHGSSVDEMNQYSVKWSKNTRNKLGIIAKTVKQIEMMAPLFKYNAFSIIYPYIVKQFVELNADLHTNWGPDKWWCGAVNLFINNSIGCIVVYYTPIIHLNFKTTIKTDQYLIDGHEIIKRLEKQYQQFYRPKLFANHQEFYIDNISVKIQLN